MKKIIEAISIKGMIIIACLLSACGKYPKQIHAGIVIGKKIENTKNRHYNWLILAGATSDYKCDTGVCLVSDADYEQYRVGDIYPSGVMFIPPQN